MAQDTFKNLMINSYNEEELKDIAHYGCGGGVVGLIYYEETTDIYFRYSEELHELIDSYHVEVGEFPDFIVKNLGDGVQFRNAVVWFCAEYVASQLINQLEEV